MIRVCRVRQRAWYQLPPANRESRRNYRRRVFTEYNQAPQEARDCILFLLAQARIYYRLSNASEASQAAEKIRQLLQMFRDQLHQQKTQAGSFPAMKGQRSLYCRAKGCHLRFKFVCDSLTLTVRVADPAGIL